jgi:hypothetical protein
MPKAGDEKLTTLLRRPPIDGPRPVLGGSHQDFMAHAEPLEGAAGAPTSGANRPKGGGPTRLPASPCFLEFAAPQVKCHCGEIMFSASYEVVHQEVCCGFVGMGLEPGERRSDNFFGVAVEFEDKRRKKSERMATQGTQEASDWNGMRFGQADKAAHVAPMPPQASHLLATLTLAGL